MTEIIKTSFVTIQNKEYSDKYKLEIYKNGNLKIINKTNNKNYFEINDNIEMSLNLINTYIFLFETISNIEQLNDFINSLGALKNNLKFIVPSHILHKYNNIHKMKKM